MEEDDDSYRKSPMTGIIEATRDVLEPGVIDTESSIWSQRVGESVAVPELVRMLGADPARVLAMAGLAPDALSSREGRIPYTALGRVFDEASRSTGCAHFGLLVGRAWRLSSMGIVGEIMANSPTVGASLRALMHFHHLNSDGGLTFLLERCGAVDLGYAIYHGGARGVEHIYDAVLAAGCNFLRELCGPGFIPTDVFLAHAPPMEMQHYRSIFKINPRFNSEFSAIRFSAQWMERPIAGADPERLRDATARASAIPPLTFQHQVCRTLRVQLLRGVSGGDDVARALGMNRRTLNRRLQAEGTTYQTILDQIRFEVACQLLANSHVALDDIAEALGYASVTPFMRTFRRWSNTTPSRWRRMAGAALHPVDTAPGTPA